MELLKMLCAAFPLDPLRAFHAPGNTLPLEDLYQLAPPSRSFADMASDRDIFWWGGLENGMLPTGFSDRLARIDACEEAESAFTRFEGETARLYQILEEQLKKQQARGSSFIALDRPTIADFAFWTWVRIARFGNIDLSPYPTVQKWCATIENDAKSQAAVQKLPIK